MILDRTLYEDEVQQVRKAIAETSPGEMSSVIIGETFMRGNYDELRKRANMVKGILIEDSKGKGYSVNVYSGRKGSMNFEVGLSVYRHKLARGQN